MIRRLSSNYTCLFYFFIVLIVFQLFSANSLSVSGLTPQETVDLLVEYGKKGADSEPFFSDISAIFKDKNKPLILRAYPAWACEKIKPRPFSERGKTYHVATESPVANDTNPGTIKYPWKTIQKAAETLRPGDTALIHKGIYREYVRPFREGTGPQRMITYKAAPGEIPVITGADLWTPEWRQEENNCWSAPYQRLMWDHLEKWGRDDKNPLFRCEQIIVDNYLLKHVAEMAELIKQTRTFLTDDKNSRIWIHLADTSPPGNQKVERAIRYQVFGPAVSNLGYIRVQGLTMRYAASPEKIQPALSHCGIMTTWLGHHWIIEDNTIEWGNAQGLDIGAGMWRWYEEPGVYLPPYLADTICIGYHQILRNHVNHNGIAGIVGSAKQSNVLLDGNETSFNCWKGYFEGYELAGVKFHTAENFIIRRHRAVGNRASGIWLDWNCHHCRVTQCILIKNVSNGFFFEASHGPLLVDNNVVIGTQDSPMKYPWGDGLYYHDGDSMTYANNYIADVKGYGIQIRHGFDRKNADGTPFTASYNCLYNNFIFNCGRGAISILPDVPGATSNASDENAFGDDSQQVMMTLTTEWMKGLVDFSWNKTPVGKALGKSGTGNITVHFINWQHDVGLDKQSVIVNRTQLFPDTTPERILEKLVSIWPKEAIRLEAGYGSGVMQSISSIVGFLLQLNSQTKKQHVAQ